MTQSRHFVDGVAWSLSRAVKLARPWQWVKNLLVFAPLFFAGDFLREGALTSVALAALAFCFAASAAYVGNDILDRERDQAHPKKRYRPLAAGEISLRGAYLSLGAWVLALVVVVSYEPVLLVPIGAYLALNAAYSTFFKHVAVVDAMVVAACYLLRLIAGGAAAKVSLSPWIVLCVFFTALFVVFGKRRAEYGAHDTRPALAGYSATALDLMLGASLTLALATYALWSVIGRDYSLLVYSTFFVVFAALRIANAIYQNPKGAESPETLLFKDGWILASLVAWVAMLLAILYA